VPTSPSPRSLSRQAADQRRMVGLAGHFTGAREHLASLGIDAVDPRARIGSLAIGCSS